MGEDPKQCRPEDIQLQNAEADSPDEPQDTFFILICYGKILQDLFNPAQSHVFLHQVLMVQLFPRDELECETYTTSFHLKGQDNRLLLAIS